VSYLIPIGHSRAIEMALGDPLTDATIICDRCDYRLHVTGRMVYPTGWSCVRPVDANGRPERYHRDYCPVCAEQMEVSP
jgi:hypothetical protein